MDYAQLRERKVTCDTTGGYITIRLLRGLLEQTTWTEESTKHIVTTLALWEKIRDRVSPYRGGKGNDGQRVQLYREQEEIRFEVEGTWEGSILADPLCPPGTVWLVDSSFLPWTSGVLVNIE